MIQLSQHLLPVCCVLCGSSSMAAPEPTSANRDEANKCIAIARRALADGDYERAERFASKAQAMHPSVGVSCELCVKGA